MGVLLDAQKNCEQPYVRAVERFITLSCYRALRVHLRPAFIWRMLGYEAEQNAALEVLHSFTANVRVYAKLVLLFLAFAGHKRTNRSL